MKTRCPECGTKLELAGSAFTPSTRPRREWAKDAGKVELITRCPNPDCPGKDSDMAKATGPDGAQP